MLAQDLGMQKEQKRNVLVNETEWKETEQGHKVDPGRIENRRRKDIETQLGT